MSERADQARCQNSTCSPGSYFRASALKYSICPQLNPRRATTSSSAECLLRLPNVGSGTRVGRTRTHTLWPAKSNKKDTGPRGEEKTCRAGEHVTFSEHKEKQYAEARSLPAASRQTPLCCWTPRIWNTSTQMNQWYFQRLLQTLLEENKRAAWFPVSYKKLCSYSERKTERLFKSMMQQNELITALGF